MHCCMGFRMLRVSDPRRSDALVLRAMVSDPRHSDALVCGGFVIFAGNNEFVI